jgi:hypothetical protein
LSAASRSRNASSTSGSTRARSRTSLPPPTPQEAAEGLRFEARRAGGGLVFGAEGAELGDAVRVGGREIVPTAEE